MESVRVSSGHEPRNRDHKIRDITATARVVAVWDGYEKTLERSSREETER